jgi:hypothetical protein
MDKLGFAAELDQRRRGERLDSVTAAILEERARHLERLQENVVFPGGQAEEHASALRLLNLGLGRKKVRKGLFLFLSQRRLYFCSLLKALSHAAIWQVI